MRAKKPQGQAAGLAVFSWFEERLALVALVAARYFEGDEVVVLDVLVLEPGDEVVVLLVVEEELLLPPLDPLPGFTTVVLLSAFLSVPSPGVTTVDFCSQPPRSAAPAKMQRYFFMFV